MRSPMLPLECTVLLKNSPSGLTLGQTVVVNDGPWGLPGSSNQMPCAALPAATLWRKKLVGDDVQNVEGPLMSDLSIDDNARVRQPRLPSMTLNVSTPSSTK